jgi:hypothetical protein
MMRFLITLAGTLVFFTGPPVLADAFPGFPGQIYPTIGNDRHPSILFDFGPGGVVTTFRDTTQGPYDGSDDAYIGVRNHSGARILNLPLAGTTGIYGFDGDGIDRPADGGSYNQVKDPQNPDRTGYGGPRVFFTVFSGNSGVINIDQDASGVFGLADGDFLWFSLETALSVIFGNHKVLIHGHCESMMSQRTLTAAT